MSVTASPTPPDTPPHMHAAAPNEHHSITQSTDLKPSMGGAPEYPHQVSEAPGMPYGSHPYGIGPHGSPYAMTPRSGQLAVPPPTLFVRPTYYPTDLVPGSLFTMHILTPYNAFDLGWQFYMSFHGHQVHAMPSTVSYHSEGWTFALECRVPHLPLENVCSMPIHVSVTDYYGQILSMFSVGPVTVTPFEHHDSAHLAEALPNWSTPRPRPSVRTNDTTPTAASHLPQAVVPHPIYTTPERHRGSSFSTASYSGGTSTPSSEVYHSHGRHHPASARRTLAAMSPSVLAPRSEGYRIVKKPAATPESATPLRRTFAVGSTPNLPALVRTSTLRTPRLPRSNQGLEQYDQYSHRRSDLRVEGDLTSMTRDWSFEERTDCRRLVEFTRRQEDNVLTVDFRAVTRETRTPNGICVSCIWWEEKNEYYITSVDSIYLLEAIVGNRFSVEEKNRVRRNLEGFRPMTIAKGVKNDAEKKDGQEVEQVQETGTSKKTNDNFFDTIMGFPEPKPRNIEKDIKVFPWKVLPEALQKILSKYSASYASTASYYSTPSKPMSRRDSCMESSPSPTTGSGMPERAPTPVTTSSRPSFFRAASQRARARPNLRLQTSSPSPAPIQSSVSAPASFIFAEPETPQAVAGSDYWLADAAHHMHAGANWSEQSSSYASSELCYTTSGTATASSPDEELFSSFTNSFDASQPSHWGH